MAVLLKRLSLASTGILLFLSACTAEVSFGPVDPSKPIEGVVYHLPATALDVQMNFEITNCAFPGTIAVQDVSIRSEIIPDPDSSAVYVLDHRKLRNGLKVIEAAKIEMHGNGLLKKITYTAQDQTREVIKDATGVATKIALAASGLPIPTGSFGDLPMGRRPSPCNEETQEALRQKFRLVSDMVKLEQQLEESFAAFVKTPTNDAAAKVDLLKQQLDNASERLASLKSKQLVLIASSRIIPRPSALLDIPVEMNPDIFFKWFRKDILQNPKTIGDIVKLTLTFSRLPNDPFQPSPNDAHLTGVVYRLPSLVRLQVKHVTSGRVVELQDLPILQLGRLARFEVKNGIFQNTIHEIEYGTGGNVALYNFSDKAAQARAAIGAVGDVVPHIANFEQQKLSQQTELERKQKELLEAETARIRAERELAEERAK